MYIYAEQQGVLVVNKPQSLRDFNEKLFITHFPQYCTPSLVTHHIAAVKQFLAEHEDIIIKPLMAWVAILFFDYGK